MIVTIDPLLDAGDLATARSLLASADWSDGRITAGTQAAQAKNNRQLAEDEPNVAPLRRLVLQALSRSAMFFAAALPLKILPPFFNRYADEANAYGAHVDGAMRQAPDGSYVRTDLSATLFLSDPDSYDGGELLIDDTFGTHCIKLPAGSLVLYPSSSVHQVTPVTRGERLASFLFMQSMVRDEGKRRLLYEMDMALLNLRASVGETAPVVQLTGTYHNLLRQWADSCCRHCANPSPPTPTAHGRHCRRISGTTSTPAAAPDAHGTTMKVHSTPLRCGHVHWQTCAAAIPALSCSGARSRIRCCSRLSLTSGCSIRRERPASQWQPPHRTRR